MNRITADGDTIMRQAPMTIDHFLLQAKKNIDSIFEEEGYAKKNPELVIAYLKSSTIEEIGTLLAQQIRSGLTEISEAIESIKDQELD